MICSIWPTLFSFFSLAPVNEISKVHVDCTRAGKGELNAAVVGQGTNVLSPVAVRPIGENTYEVTYSVPSTGSYELAIKYDDVHIPGSPFIVTGFNRAHPEEVGKLNTIFI